MFEIIALLCLANAIALLCILSAIDLKEQLLPNEFVMGLAMTGAVFHLATAWHYMGIEKMVLGAFVGGGLLYLVRAGANFYYKQEALGLGDVKLLAAAGIWLGPYYVLMALTLGAAAGLLHGVGKALVEKRKTGTMPPFNKLSLPAGPGFAVGILLVGIFQFHTIKEALWP